MRNNVYDNLISKETSLAVIGLGYVGLPIAIAFSKKINVVGYDSNSSKIGAYRNGLDGTKEVGNDAVSNCSVEFTDDPSLLNQANFIIVAVPTPVNDDHTPDLSLIESASRTVGQHIKEGTIVVYESTVYPGVTEEICVPIIEQESDLKCGRDFFVGYSPERINPGDKEHRLENITKIVSGMDEDTLDQIAKVYELVVDAGVYRAESIKVAEAAKVIENSQRDINIAFMNELSIIFDTLGIDTKSVLRAAGTKWNFLNFQPGLVGGHCIGVDPYYLTYKAQELGYEPEVILAGRRINDGMGKHVAQLVVKQLVQAGINLQESRVAILGLTFKENCPDIRNTRVIDIIKELQEFGIEPIVTDTQANEDETEKCYGIKLTTLNEISNVDALIIAVAHDEFRMLTWEQIHHMFNNTSNYNIIYDVKGILDRGEAEKQGFIYGRL